MVDTTDEWIRERTGIERRHIAAAGQTTADLAEQAARRAMEAAGVTAADIDFIVVGTTTPDVIFPNVGCLVQDRLGIHGCAAFSVEAACSGFLYALSIADRFVASGQARCALVIGAETLSRITDWTDRTTCVLFGDGAGAVVLQPAAEPGILSCHLGADGGYKDLLYVPYGPSQRPEAMYGEGSFIQMKGNEVFKVAVKTLEGIAQEALGANQIERSAIDWLIPHQANLRIIQATAKRLAMPMEQVILTLAGPRQYLGCIGADGAGCRGARWSRQARRPAAAGGIWRWLYLGRLPCQVLRKRVMRPAPINRWRATARRVLAGVFAIACASVQAEALLLAPGSDLVGAVGAVRAAFNDTLTDIARRTGLGYEDMLRANPGVDPWLPGQETEVVLPTRYVLPTATRQGLVVNLPEYRLYYYTRVGGQPVVTTFPVSIGRMDWETPLGRHRILSKQAQPTWYPPASIRAEHAAEGDILPRSVPPGPANPLGDYAMRLSQSGYLIHGTNKPVGIGMQVTHGCIRMYPEDIAWLFPQVAVGAAVEIVNEPYKFGWAADGLYLEVHPHLEGDERADADGSGMTQVMHRYVRATEGRPAQVDWDLVAEVYRAKLGIPVRVGAGAPAVPQTAAQAGRSSRKYPEE